MLFAEIFGQDRAVSCLRRAWVGGRLPQAYCFTGPVGVGKRMAALALAQAVNCLTPTGVPAAPDKADACGRCVSCRKIAAGSHPDVTEVRPEGKAVITIDQIREVVARASLRAYEGRTKVWILDPADAMQEPAANAILKTLEEPPGESLLILVTATPSALLATIRSRCLEVRFGPLGEGWLRAILTRHGRSPEAAALAGGSAARALGLDLEKARADRDGLLQQVWGALESLPAVLDCAEVLAKDREALAQALEVLAGVSRDVALINVGGAEAPLLHQDRRMELAALAARHATGAILEIYGAQVDAQRALARNANPRFTAERMLLRMRRAVRGGQEDTHGQRSAR